MRRLKVPYFLAILCDGDADERRSEIRVQTSGDERGLPPGTLLFSGVWKLVVTAIEVVNDLNDFFFAPAELLLPRPAPDPTFQNFQRDGATVLAHVQDAGMAACAVVFIQHPAAGTRYRGEWA